MIRKIRLLSKFMTSQPEKQTIAIHILPNISRSKRNQAIKFGQFIEYNMRPIFLEKSYLVGVKKLFPDHYLWINSFPKFVFLVYQVEGFYLI